MFSEIIYTGDKRSFVSSLRWKHLAISTCTLYRLGTNIKAGYVVFKNLHRIRRNNQVGPQSLSSSHHLQLQTKTVMRYRWTQVEAYLGQVKTLFLSQISISLNSVINKAQPSIHFKQPPQPRCSSSLYMSRPIHNHS